MNRLNEMLDGKKARDVILESEKEDATKKPVNPTGPMTVLPKEDMEKIEKDLKGEKK